ncbi:MAG: glutathione-disulfide reductase [Pseudohongiellaceae bacterium]
MYDFDLFVIGAGSGGVRTARMAAGYGARVAVVEDRYLGGTCVNVGCVPKKLYSFAAHYYYDFQDSAAYGWSGLHPQFDWVTLRENKKKEITRLNGIYENLLDTAQVTLIQGRGKILDSHTVAVGGQRYSCRYILVATGGWPFIPEIPGAEHVITSNEVFDLEEFPQRLLVVGGGYIAVEFAGIMAGLGAQTSLSYRGEVPLRGFDEDIRRFFLHETGHYMNLLMQTDVTGISRDASGQLQVSFEQGQTLEVDCVLYATGRRPNISGLGLENTRVETRSNGAIKVDKHFCSAEPSVYALGDVVGRMELTPVALAEGMILAQNLFAGGEGEMRYDNIATAVFSHPNIGTVGLSEEQAREKVGQVDIYKSDFRHLKHTLTGRQARTFMKVIVNPADDRVLGIHMVGDDAGEIIQGFAVAMTCGLTKSQLDSSIGIHPTAAEELLSMRKKEK